MKSRVPCTTNTCVVRFDKVEIFEFPYTIGDSPSVSCGAPLAMYPRHQDRHIFEFQEYEEAKMTIPRRTKRQMAMDAELRTHILLNCGYSLARICEAAAAAKKARELRQESAMYGATLFAVGKAKLVARRKVQSFVCRSIKRQSFANSPDYRNVWKGT